MRLIRIEILTSLVNLDDLELPLDTVPVEDALDARPSTPFKTAPTGLGGSDAGLGEAGDVDVGAIYAGMTDSVGISILGRERRRRRRGRMIRGRGRTTSPGGNKIMIGGRTRPRTTRAALSVAVYRIGFGVSSILLRGAGGMGIGVRIGMSHATTTAASGSSTRRLRVPAAGLEDTGGVGLLKDTVVFRVLV